MWKWETENDAKGVVVIAHNILEHTGRYAYVITMLDEMVITLSWAIYRDKGKLHELKRTNR